MKVLLVLVAFIANAWATSLLNNRIFYGRNATRGQFPHMLSLMQERKEKSRVTKYRHICGGAIISPKWGITSAHCVDPQKRPLRVVAGITNLKEQGWEGQTVAVEETIVLANHPSKDNYTSAYNDIALLKFKIPLKFGPLIQHIPLPAAGSVPNLGNFRFSGWGHAVKLYPGGKYYEVKPDQLQYTDMKLYTNNDEECLSPKVFCTVGVHDSHGSKADRGGPLEQNGELVGIYSIHYWNVNVFCKVSDFISFIEKHVKDLP